MPLRVPRASARLLAGLAVAAAGAGAGLAAPGGAAADQILPPCFRDGLGTDGANLGGRPNRFAFANGPYLAVRYDHCNAQLRFFLGGARGITHYTLRWYSSKPDDLRQVEIPGGAARTYTVRAGDLYGARVWANVQGCRRGAARRRSTCTRWSPTVSVAVFHP